MIKEIFEIIWMCLTFLGIITFTITANRIISIIKKRYSFINNMEYYKNKYSEEDIINHLNYIINETLNNYIIMNIKPKNIYYITNAIENDINTALAELVPQKISPILYSQLSMIYDPNYIGRAIGEQIYMVVLNYVLNYNLENAQNK